MSFKSVAGETLKPQRISETSWILLTETPASYISIIASYLIAGMQDICPFGELGDLVPAAALERLGIV